MKLTGKTRAELEACLAGKNRAELLDIVFSLVTFERLLTAREIADASHVGKRDVIQAMRDGCFVDPIFGRGFFCRSGNSLRVSASAANAWRRSFFVPVIPANPIATLKKGKAPEIVVGGRNLAQIRAERLAAVGLVEVDLNGGTRAK